MAKNHLLLALAALIVIGSGAYVLTRATPPAPEMVKDVVTVEASQASMEEGKGAMADDMTPSRPDETVGMESAGSYEAYAAEKLARAQTGKVVLFFRASWCPTCRALDADIQEHLAAIPHDVTILDVNYDTEKALAQTYAVTYQHTLVQVDAQGRLLAKWSGSPTLLELLSHLK